MYTKLAGMWIPCNVCRHRIVIYCTCWLMRVAANSLITRWPGRCRASTMLIMGRLVPRFGCEDDLCMLGGWFQVSYFNLPRLWWKGLTCGKFGSWVEIEIERLRNTLHVDWNINLAGIVSGLQSDTWSGHVYISCCDLRSSTVWYWYRECGVYSFLVMISLQISVFRVAAGGGGLRRLMRQWFMHGIGFITVV